VGYHLDRFGLLYLPEAMHSPAVVPCLDIGFVPAFSASSGGGLLPRAVIRENMD